MKSITILTLGILMSILLISSCKNPETFSDPALIGSCRLDSVGAVYSTVFFKDSNKGGPLLINTFGSDNITCSFTYGGGVQGGGKYSYDASHKINAKVSRGDFLLVFPYWSVVYLDVLNNAQTYSINGNQLTIIYLDGYHIAKFTKI
jgi:hypothetical protein